MGHRINWKKKNSFWKSLFLPVLIFLLLICFLYFGVLNVSSTSDKEGKKVLENALHKATVQCYAIEGTYPPNIEYLEDNYGVIIDKEKYIVHYDAFSDNIMPVISVIAIN